MSLWKRMNAFFRALSETPAVEHTSENLAHAYAIALTRGVAPLDVRFNTQDLTVRMETPDDLLSQAK